MLFGLVLTSFLGIWEPPKPEEKHHEVTNKVFLDLTQGNETLGRIVIGLYEKDTPKTAGYFKQIATEGINGTTFKGALFHFIVDGFKVQAGEGVDLDLMTDKDGLCYYTIEEEDGKVAHTDPGIVSLARRAPHKKWTEFFISTIAAPWLDYHDTGFGKVLEGMDIVYKMEKTNVTIECRPTIPIVITNCGVLPLKKT